MKANREGLLNAIQAVSSGLSDSRDTTEQSTCFCFKDSKVMTFNGEIANVRDSGLGNEIEGAVIGSKLLFALQKFPGEEVELTPKNGHLIVAALKGGKKAAIRMEAEIVMPIDQVEQPDKWTPLPDSFSDAVNAVHHCAGSDDTFFYLTCVHIHPNHIETFDNYQACRWVLETGVSQPILLKQTSIKHILPLGVTHIGETDHWVHFKNKAKQVFSCRRYVEDYPNLDDYFAVKGEKIALPKALVEACECANEFSQDSAGDNLISIDLQPNKLLVKAVGAYGWYREPKRVVYNGPPLQFMIPPAVLADLVKRHSECIVSDRAILVDGEVYKYATRTTVLAKETE